MESKTRVALLTALAMAAFAGNSLLCRAALLPDGDTAPIDPVSFTAIRLLAGALVLAPVRRPRPGAGALPRTGLPRALRAGTALFLYALAFSFSYTRIETGTGALILFGVVQLTLFTAALRAGEPIGARRAIGALLAFGGLGLLLAPHGPDLRGVDPAGAGLMGLAGVGWGLYTLLGRGSTAPLRDNAVNFRVALAPTLVVLGVLALRGHLALSPRGLGLAIASGAICSGLGYSIWYRALRHHTSVSAAISQLTVPVLAAALGALLLRESLTLAFGLSATLVLFGVALGLKPSRPGPKAGA